MQRDDVILWGGHGFHIVQYPLRHKSLFNIVAVFKTENIHQRADAETYRKVLMETYADACPTMLDMLRMMDVERRWVIADRDPIRQWSKGRVTLLGDAAHPMLQYLAQGAGMALEDSLSLARCLDEADSVEAAFKAYPLGRFLRTGRVQLSARIYGEFYHADGVRREFQVSLAIGTGALVKTTVAHDSGTADDSPGRSRRRAKCGVRAGVTRLFDNWPPPNHSGLCTVRRPHPCRAHEEQDGRQAADGEQALALAFELKPDLVILDVKMPVMDGITAAEQIVAARLAPVLMLTAFSQTELIERAKDAGAMAYLVKPFSLPDLIPAIEIAVSRHQQILSLESEVLDLGERLETRKLIDRAKALLMGRMSLSEADAFRWIQKASMDRRVSMKAVAQALLSQYPEG